MRYMGGKGRIAKKLAEVIVSNVPEHSGVYYEPFVGGGGMAVHMAKHFDEVRYSDIHPDLVLMWKALQDGWKPPTVVSYDEYQDLRYQDEPSALRGFVGFGGSFGGRWFEGYARGGHNADGTPRNHQAESSRAVQKDIARMFARHKTSFECLSVFNLEPKPGDVVYCDPPYAGTKKYSKTDHFNHGEFWKLMSAWANNGVHVFVSEYDAPPEWEVVWERELRSSVRHGADERHIATEKLFTLRKDSIRMKPRRLRIKRK